MPVNAITTVYMRAVLEPIWTTKTETADRLRGRIERILASVKALELRSGENPAAWKENLAELLRPAGRVKKAEHHKSLPWERCPAFFASLLSREGQGVRALVLTTLTAVRTTEPLGARWRELDLEKLTWTISAERMKGKKMYRVPLSNSVIALLEATPVSERDPAAYLFHDGNPTVRLSNMTMAAVLKRRGLDDATVHGFRFSFKA